jgi:hypothetical protein
MNAAACVRHPAAGRQKGASTTGTTHKDEHDDLVHHGGFEWAGRRPGAGRTRPWRQRRDRRPQHRPRAGDPDRAAHAIIGAVNGEQAPFRLLLGTDAVQIVRDEFLGRISEIDAWAHVSATSDFPGTDEHG